MLLTYYSFFMHTDPYLLGEFAVLINMAYLFTAEVSGCFSTGAAVDWGLWVPLVVMAVACR